MASPEEQEAQEKWKRHFFHRYVNLKFPANIASNDKDKPLRTNKDLVQWRLLEAGVPFNDPVELWKSTATLNKFVAVMQKSGCFEHVNVELDPIEGVEQTNNTNNNTNERPPTEQLNVTLQEKNWYRLYVGGGIRNDMQAEIGQMGMDLLAKTQFETSAGFRNLTGNLDITNLQYTVDATAQSRWAFEHRRPLDGLFIPLGINPLSDIMDTGEYSLGFHAALDTLDFEWTRSYRERQRKVSLRLSNHGEVHYPEMANDVYTGLEWSWLFRDILPRRHPTLPYALDASPEIAAQSGPSEKNSITWEYRTNGSLCDNKFNPTQGIDYYSKVEIAGPPGDVGFVKVQGGGAVHVPISPSENFDCSIHGTFHTGLLQSLAFGGACRPPTVSDRFFVDKAFQLRGFCPSGIGPRAKASNTAGSASPQGDSLGGEFFYTATLAASTTTESLAKYGIRLMAFGNVGTLAGSLAAIPSWTMIAKSSRAAVGLGISGSLPLGRVEATYSWPIRFGPRDMKKSFQAGVGFSFG
jgi:Omp85 superfamily domain